MVCDVSLRCDAPSFPGSRPAHPVLFEIELLHESGAFAGAARARLPPDQGHAERLGACQRGKPRAPHDPGALKSRAPPETPHQPHALNQLPPSGRIYPPPSLRDRRAHANEAKLRSARAREENYGVRRFQPPAAESDGEETLRKILIDALCQVAALLRRERATRAAGLFRGRWGWDGSKIDLLLNLGESHLEHRRVKIAGVKRRPQRAHLDERCALHLDTVDWLKRSRR